MENFVSLLAGFQVLFSPENLGACALGAVLGLIVGAMPGLGSLAGVALLLPLTYKFNPTTAIIMLGALYYSNMYGAPSARSCSTSPAILPPLPPLWTAIPWRKRAGPVRR